MSAKVSTATPRASLASKLDDALNDGRAVKDIPISKLPKAAQKDAAEGEKQSYSVTAHEFQYGKSTFDVVQKYADDAYTIDDFYSKKTGKFAGSQEDDM